MSHLKQYVLVLKFVDNAEVILLLVFFGYFLSEEVKNGETKEQKRKTVGRQQRERINEKKKEQKGREMQET